MSSELRKKRLTRRTFLIGAGAVAGASLLPVAWSAWQARPLALKAGLLLPDAASYPGLADQVRAGLEAASHPALAQLELITAQIDAGAGLATAQAQALLQEARADLVIAYINSRVATRLRPIFEAARRPLIVLDTGANVVHATERSPFVFYNSLGHWQAAYMAGRRLVEQHGPRVFIASALFDSGFDSLNAVQQGVRDSGGEVVQTYVTHVNPRDTGIAAALDAIRSTRPHSVFALYAGAPAADFVGAYFDAGLSGTLPLTGSGFLTEGLAAQKLGGRAAGVASLLGWAADPSHPIVVARADAFAALGVDTVGLIGAAVEAAGEPAHWGESSLTLAFDGARGALRLDPATRVLASPLHWRTGRLAREGLLNVSVEAVPFPERSPEIPEMQAAWLNPYLSS